MTNKLEEVFKELQESHVLVDREEYERLLEKAEELDVEEVNFEVGRHYTFEDAIFKIIGLGTDIHMTSFYSKGKDYIDTSFIVYADSMIAEEACKATDEEIKLFKRAEMYHKHGRKLDDLRRGDFVTSGNDIYQVNQGTFFIQSIIDGERELYLTLEEAQEAHKKIVGE